MSRIGRFFSFSGRTSRLGYWRIQLMAALILGVAWSLGLFLATSLEMGSLGVLGIIVAAPALVVGVAAAVRRLHDRNRSGWWLLPFTVAPVAGSLFLRTQAGDSPSSEWTTITISLAVLALTVWGWAEIGFLRGTAGMNRFGPDPHGSAR